VLISPRLCEALEWYLLEDRLLEDRQEPIPRAGKEWLCLDRNRDLRVIPALEQSIIRINPPISKERPVSSCCFDQG